MPELSEFLKAKVSSSARGITAVRTWIPILQWLPTYQKSWLRFDLIAGATIGALLVPQAMAYATLAGVPPEYGLFAAPLALAAYVAFGTSRHLVVGPGAGMAAMSALVVAPLAMGDPVLYNSLTVLLAMVVGGILLLAGILRLGVIADLLSKPILSGFIVGMALTIVAGQVAKLLGYSVPDAGFFEELWNLIRNLGQTHVPTFGVGIGSLVLLYGIRKRVPRLPAAIVVFVIGIAVSAGFNLADHGVAIVGDVKGGLPPIGFPAGVGWSDVTALFVGAVSIALVAFAESVAAARSYAAKHGYEIDPNQELVALGMTNASAGMGQGLVVDGSLSRTAAADQAGGKTPMASLVGAVIVLVVAALFTPLFRNLPLAVLGAVIIDAVWRLVDFSQLKRFYQLKLRDFAAAAAAMLGVLTIGILEGLLIAVGISVVWLLLEARRPATAILGKIPGQNTFRNIKNFPGAETYPGLLIFRFDGSLFFANARIFRDDVRQAVAADPSVRTVLINAEAVNDIDVTALEMLQELATELEKSKIDLRFARVKTHVRNIMRSGGLEDVIGANHFHASVRSGVSAYQMELRGYQVAEEQEKEGDE